MKETPAEGRRTCPLCWGQRYLLERVADIYIPVMCDECVGHGDIPPKDPQPPLMETTP